MKTDTPKTEEQLVALTRALTDNGRLIEAGWASLAFMSLPSDVSNEQWDDMRNAFFAGAQHLFASIMAILDPGAEPTDKDLERMDSIDKELRQFLKEMKVRVGSRAHRAH